MRKMHVFFIVLFVVFFLLPFLNDLSDKNKLEKAINSNEFYIDDCKVCYEKTEIAYNMASERCIVIYYTFENTSDENQTFGFLATTKAFQSGVEIEPSIWHVNEESKNTELEIKPGTTITVASGFVLRDNTDVTFEVEEWLSLDEETVYSITVPVE